MNVTSTNFNKLKTINEALADPAKLMTHDFYEVLKGRKVRADKKINRNRVVELIQNNTKQALMEMAGATPGNSLHLVQGKQELDKLLKEMKGNLEKYTDSQRPYAYAVRFADPHYEDLKEVSNETADLIQRAIARINTNSRALFDRDADLLSSEIAQELQTATDHYLADALGIKGQINLLELDNLDRLDVEENAAEIAEVVQGVLVKQPLEKSKAVGDAKNLEGHVKKISAGIEKRINEIAEKKLFHGLSNSDKAQMLNSKLQEELKTQATLVELKSNRLTVNKAGVTEAVKSYIVTPFDDKEATKSALFKEEKIGFFQTIGNFFASLFKPKDPEVDIVRLHIKAKVSAAISQYYGSSDNATKKELYLKSQLYTEQLIEEIKNELAPRFESENPAVTAQLDEQALRDVIQAALVKKLGLKDRLTKNLHYNKQAADINHIFTTATQAIEKDIKANEGTAAQEHYRKIELVYKTLPSLKAEKEALEELAKIPETDDNREMLQAMWKHLLASSYPAKELKHSAAVEKYRNYLVVKDAMPEGMREDLELFALQHVETLLKGTDIRLIVDNAKKALTKEEKEIVDIVAAGIAGQELTATQEEKVGHFMTRTVANTRINKIIGEIVGKKKSFINEVGDTIIQLIFENKELNIPADEDFVKEVKEHAGLNFFERKLGLLAFKMQKAGVPELKATDEQVQAMNFIRYLSWKTRYLDQAVKVVEKLGRNYKNYKKGAPINQQDKVSLKEMSMLRNVIRLRDEINNKADDSLHEIIANNEVFKNKVFQVAEKADDLLAKVGSQYADQAPGHYRSGDLVAEHMVRSRVLYDTRKDLEHQLLETFVSSYQHGAVFAVDKKALYISELQRSHEFNKVGYEHSLVNDIWRLDPSRLVQGNTLTHVIEMYRSLGITDWREAVRKEFEKQSLAIHKKDYENLENNTKNRFVAGTLDWVPFGHKGKKVTDWEKEVKAKLESEEHQNMICSEFATNTTILALIEMEKALKAKLVEHYKKQKNTALEAHYQKADTHLFEIPYPRDLKLDTVHPGMMVDLLKKKGCLQKIEPPKILKAMFAV